MPRRSTLAISMGDPLGIGPEVLVRALTGGARPSGQRVHLYGWAPALDRACAALGVEPFWWRVPTGTPAGHVSDAHEVVLHDLGRELGLTEDLLLEEPGPTRAGGMLSFVCVERAIERAMLPANDPDRADAVVTAPISKAAWALAGKSRYPGHTELLAARSGARRFRMMFSSDELRVALATAHIPLMELRNTLTIGRVHETIDLAHEFCRDLGVEEPRIAVCGLNPHAGEGGLLGDEDERIIAPAITLAQEAGLRAVGPLPADTVFAQARLSAPPSRRRFDLVVAMYHDQGLIPVKLLAFDNAVNCTQGLPFVRTSPDHGTGYDIARKFKADAGSMSEAIRLAGTLVRSRRGVPVERA